MIPQPPPYPQGKMPGVHFPPGGLPVARVWAPRARMLVMEVEGKNPIRLQKAGSGYWEAFCPDLQPGDRYCFRINGRSCYPDPASLSQPDGVHGLSEAVDIQTIRDIRDKDWKGIAHHNLVIYELHVGTFTPAGNFQGVRDKLGYLKDLGVNAIEVMPVASFPGKRNWGYDGVLPFAVQHSYGGPIEFAKLVRDCHRHGIAVILDVVYNHLGPEGNILPAFGPYISKRHRTPWGKAINFDGEHCEGVRNYFIENALMWLRDFHVDGLRLDAVHAIVDEGPVHFLKALSQQVRALNVATGSQHFLVGETGLNDTRYTEPEEKGGHGLQGQWCDNWHHAMHALLTGENQGYYAGFGQVWHLVKSFNEAFIKTLAPERFVVYTQNHDQVGNRLKGERLASLSDFESLKLAAGALLASPFIPMLFMGEEFAADTPFLFFVDYGDPKVVERVRRGRKREFRAFFGNISPPDPAALESFLHSRLNWDLTGSTRKKQMLAYYRKLIALRKEYIVPASGNGQPLRGAGNQDHPHAQATPCGKGIILTHQGEKGSGQSKESHHPVTVVLNFSGEEMVADVPLEPGYMPELLVYSAHRKWGGPVSDQAVPYTESNGRLRVRTAVRSMLIMRLMQV